MSETKKLSMRERNKIQTRAHVLEAATTLFGAKGFAATSIDDIVAESGASRATVYAHFPGKEALLAEIVLRMWHETLEHYEAFGALADWSRGSLLDWLSEYAEHWERTASRSKAAFEASLPSIMSDAPRWHQRQVAAVRSNSDLWREFPIAEADLRASILVNAVQAEMTSHFFGEERLDTPEFLGYLADAIRALLGVA